MRELFRGEQSLAQTQVPAGRKRYHTVAQSILCYPRCVRDVIERFQFSSLSLRNLFGGRSLKPSAAADAPSEKASCLTRRCRSRDDVRVIPSAGTAACSNGRPALAQSQAVEVPRCAAGIHGNSRPPAAGKRAKPPRELVSNYCLSKNVIVLDSKKTFSLLTGPCRCFAITISSSPFGRPRSSIGR